MTLDEKIKEVKPSSRLKDPISCLSGDDYGMSAYMERIMKASGQEAPEVKCGKSFPAQQNVWRFDDKGDREIRRTVGGERRQAQGIK